MPILRHVYDPATGTYHDVEVTQEVYGFYRRSAWNIQKKNQRFYTNEIQFSSLVGGLNQAFENFSEFRSSAGDPQQLLCDTVTCRMIAEAFQKLSPADRRILRVLIIEGHTERWYAERTGLTQQSIHKRKKYALRRLRNILNKSK